MVLKYGKRNQQENLKCLANEKSFEEAVLLFSDKYDKCPNGIIGLETMIPIIYTHFVKTNIISLDKFLDVMTYNPIKVFNLDKRDFKVGSIADIAVIDIENEHTYSEDEILSMGKNSPFIGMKFYGFTKYTLVNGKLVYKN